MTGADLFSNGFAWDDVAGVATPDATPPAPASPIASSPVSQSDATALATPFSSDFGWNDDAVASVASVANQPDGVAVSQPDVALVATARATPETAEIRGSGPHLRDGVAPVASVADWSRGIEALAQGRPPPSVDPRRWRELVSDGRMLLANWGSDMVGLGWGTLEVFGANVDPRHRRLDIPGLVCLLRGRPVEAVDKDTATIRGARGDAVTFNRRLVASGGVPVWAWVEGAYQ